MREPWVQRTQDNATHQRPRIFDAFMFAGEAELLETRIHVLSSVVDVFVVIEADVAHSGRFNRSLSLPAILKDNSRLRRFAGRIHYRGIHVRGDPPVRHCLTTADRASYAAAMRCEHHIRGLLVRELAAAGARPTDIVVSSDADEIPKPEYLRPFKECSLFDSSSNLQTHPAVVIFLAETYMYNIGCPTGQNRWSYGPKVGAFFQFDLKRDQPWSSSNGMNIRRWGNSGTSGPRWENAAWHLTNFMSPARFAAKLEAFFHFRDFTREQRDVRHIKELMDKCKSPYPDKFKRMRFKSPVVGSASSDALAYIHERFPDLRARAPATR